MEICTWRDNSRFVEEKQGVAEVFRDSNADEPIQTLAWYATERDAILAAKAWITEYQK